MTRVRLCVVVAVALVTSCSLDEVDLAERRCPCAVGWTCDEVTGLCVRGSLDASRVDARPRDATTSDVRDVDAGRRDAGSRDGGRVDAGSMDGGRIDAGSMDGGRIDGGPRDAGADGGRPDPTACDDILTGALFCDGFEDPTLVAWSAIETFRGGSAERRTASPYRGVGVLFAQVPDGTGDRWGFARADVPGPITSGDLHARGYYRVPSGTALRTLNLLYLREGGAPYDGVSVSVDDGGVLSWIVPAAVDARPTVPFPFPRDRWVCVQLHVLVHDSAGAVDVSIDGSRIASRSGIDTLPAGGFSAVTVGVNYATDPQPGATVWVDEVAVGRTVIPCDM